MAQNDADFTDKSYEDRILKALRKIIRAVDINSRQLNRQSNITTPQLICLHALGQYESMTLKQLASEVSLGPSTVTGIVDRLIAKQLVVRTRSLSDRRKVALTITSAGRELLAEAPPLLQQRFSRDFSQLDAKKQLQLTEALEEVVSLMNAENLSTSPNLISGEPEAVVPTPNKEKNKCRSSRASRNKFSTPSIPTQ